MFPAFIFQRPEEDAVVSCKSSISVFEFKRELKTLGNDDSSCLVYQKGDLS